MNDLTEDCLKEQLNPRFPGLPFRFHEVTDSTQSDALNWAREGAPHGSFVLADTQSNGRGRRGRTWEGGAGKSILISFILRPQMEPDRLGLMGGAAAIAVAHALRNHTDIPAQTKWPNDVWIHGKKVAGILLELVWRESRLEAVVAGIGINVNQKPEDLPPGTRTPATSLTIEASKTWDRCALLCRLVEELNGVMERAQTDPAALLAEWKALECTLNRQVLAVDENRQIKGQVTDILGDGSLKIISDGRERQLRWGEVSILPDFE